MKAEIITIGEELLIGQVVNTNASWMAEQLNLSGISVSRITAVADAHDEIIGMLSESEKRSQLILLTGGLGPTRDDVTRDALCEYFDAQLELNQEVLDNITELFRARGLEVSGLNRRQAMVPSKARIISNPNGTAPGLWFEKDGKIFIAMPGVPFEMKFMFNQQILPRLKQWADKIHIVHRTVLTQGIGESFLSDIISTWENELPAGIQLAYLPSPGMVRIRITGKGTDALQVQQAVEREVGKLEEIIPQYIWGYDRETLQEVTGRLLQEKGQTVSTAESCTGGYIAHHIVTVPGSSEWYKGSVVAYSNEIKQKVLGVDAGLIARHGAVSQQVVEAMANHALRIFDTDYAIAVSGIAGPEGGTPEKPVGTVWIAVAGKEVTESKRFQFGDSRDRNILRSVIAALGMLRDVLIAARSREAVNKQNNA